MSDKQQTETLVEKEYCFKSIETRKGWRQTEYETGSSTSSGREAISSQERALSRKANSDRPQFDASIEAKKDSKEKIQAQLFGQQIEQLPQYRKVPQMQALKSEYTDADEQKSYPSTVIRHEAELPDLTIRFKKKALSKQQIFEIKDYINDLGSDVKDNISIITSERAIQEPQQEQEIRREGGKKSKTQFFQNDRNQSRFETSDKDSESSIIELASLRQKCHSVDETNALLSKRLKWLREEVQMHLQRQSQHKKIQSQLKKELKSVRGALDTQKDKTKKLISEVQLKNEEIRKLKELVIQLNLHFDNDREILTTEIEFLKSQTQTELQEQQKVYKEKINYLEAKIGQLQEQKCSIENAQQVEEKNNVKYFKALSEKLLHENKYLKMQNHMLARCKEDVGQLKRQNKQILNERDTLKKKMIQSAKREAARMKMMDDSESSSLQTLSELSYSLSYTHR